tara:strand:- start:3223 stop:3630 length:408 start_codon:yes stop_codon:yes gene_type:complete
MNIIEKLVLFSLFTFFSIMSGFFMFANHLVIVFPGTEFNPMLMAEWRTRTVQPAFYMTASYFILRHFLGKNPTSTLWPVFLILLFFSITQSLLFIEKPYKFGVPGIAMFVVSIFVTILVRLSHAKRKNEIRMDTF